MKELLLVVFLSCSFCLFGQSFDTLSIRVAIEQQMAAYPESTLQDIYKSFYQDRFGPGHMISDTASARSYLIRELSEMNEASAAVYYEPTGSEGRFIRVHLLAVADGLITADQLLDAFVRSANIVKAETDWVAEWKAVAGTITKYGIRVNGFEDASLLDEASRDRQAVHHSQAYNAAYHPHYRIVERSIFEEELRPLIKE